MVEFEPFRLFVNDDAKASNTYHIHRMYRDDSCGNEPKLVLPAARVGDDKADE